MGNGCHTLNEPDLCYVEINYADILKLSNNRNINAILGYDVLIDSNKNLVETWRVIKEIPNIITYTIECKCCKKYFSKPIASANSIQDVCKTCYGKAFDIVKEMQSGFAK